MASRTRRLLSSGARATDACIVAARRTPIGGFNGSLASLSAPQLGAAAIKGAVAQSGMSSELVEQVWMGNVLSANVGQAPARQAALLANLPESACCTTINKVCSSGLRAITLGAQEICLGNAQVVVAGGMESMSNAPYYAPKARWGLRMGDAHLVDGMLKDGLWDPYDDHHMGHLAEKCAEKYHISREDQDAHANESYRRALEAIAANAFAHEIVPVDVKKRGAVSSVESDDEPQQFRGNIGSAKPAFKKEGGSVTAANASTLSDGAAALVITSRAAADASGATVLATLRGWADAEQAPSWFTTAPSAAIPKALVRAGVSLDEISLFEINEAFSVVSLANNQLLSLDPTKVNVLGGAVSLGHPIGCSGARIVCTLLTALKQRGGRYGVAAICNGGGGASAVVVEMEQHSN